MTQPAASSSARPASIARTLLADRHFVLAAGILVVTAAGWGAATRWLNLTTFKERVPWTKDAQVGSDFRLRVVPLDPNISLDANLGPFRRLVPDEERTAKDPKYRNWEVHTRQNLESLAIGTVVDRDNLADRKSNWYLVRRYVDTRAGVASRLWQLDVYYYTGGADTVPHIPDICAEASGAKVLSSGSVSFPIPAAPEDWPRTVSFHRTRYSMPNGESSAAYYVFSMNGVFGESRLWVRWELLNPFVRYAYFAKIQFSPLGGTADFEEMDRSAQEFLQYALPEVLRTLPSSRDVKALEQARR
jgi:hypothetical protein